MWHWSFWLEFCSLWRHHGGMRLDLSCSAPLIAVLALFQPMATAAMHAAARRFGKDRLWFWFWILVHVWIARLDDLLRGCDSMPPLPKLAEAPDTWLESTKIGTVWHACILCALRIFAPAWERQGSSGNVQSRPLFQESWLSASGSISRKISWNRRDNRDGLARWVPICRCKRLSLMFGECCSSLVVHLICLMLWRHACHEGQAAHREKLECARVLCRFFLYSPLPVSRPGCVYDFWTVKAKGIFASRIDIGWKLYGSKDGKRSILYLGKFAMEAWLLFHGFIGSFVMVICFRRYGWSKTWRKNAIRTMDRCSRDRK